MDAAFFSAKIRQGSFSFLLKLFRLPDKLDFFRGTIYNNIQLVRVNRLYDKVISSLLHGFNSRFYCPMPGDHNYQDCFIHFPDLPESLHSVYSRHF